MDDGQQGDFVSIYKGLEREQIIRKGIIEGRTYRFRCRALNIKGWSEFSEITYILAASAPSKPKVPPILVSVD